MAHRPRAQPECLELSQGDDVMLRFGPALDRSIRTSAGPLRPLSGRYEPVVIDAYTVGRVRPYSGRELPVVVEPCPAGRFRP